MTEPKFENKVMAKYQKIADVIRKHRRISMGKLSIEIHKAPSTVYEYWRFMRDLFPDLDYEAGVFFVKEGKHHRLPDGKLVPSER